MPNIPEQAEANDTRHEGITVAREYYDGKHNTKLNDRQKTYLSIRTGREFVDNYCPIVVDSLAERLTVTGFIVEGDKEITEAKEEKGNEKLVTQGEVFQDWWTRNRMDENQGDQHLSAIRDSDSYLIVGWDSVLNRPTFDTELAYDGDVGVEVVYSLEKRGMPEFAFKRWKTADGEMVNVYYPDRIEKFHREEKTGLAKVTGKAKWVHFKTKAWTDLPEGEGGNPLGVPVMHFKNQGQSYSYGQSELRDTIPLQNGLNKSVIDLIAAADTTAFRMLVMLGIDVGDDMKIYPGAILSSLKPPGEAEISHIPGEDLSKLIDYSDKFAMEIARVSRTPLSFFQITREVAAEGTLKQEEAGLVSRAKNRQVAFGNSWEDAMIMARRLANVFGSDYKLDETMKISTTWSDPETRNDKTQIEIYGSKHNDLGVPVTSIWAEEGYDTATIKDMKASHEFLLWLYPPEFWSGAVSAVNAGFPLEAYLTMYGVPDEFMVNIGTQKMAEIAAKQEDVIPDVEQ